MGCLRMVSEGVIEKDMFINFIYNSVENSR